MSEQPKGLADGARVVLRGDPTSAEAVAALVAIDAARRADRAQRRTRPRPAWQRAARREGVGGRRIAFPGDLR